MRQHVYIVAPEYSGSTVLDALIGTLPGFVSCGEVVTAFNRVAAGTVKRPCSCRNEMTECPVWGPLAASAETLASATVEERYAMLDRSLSELYGADYTMVDSSKRLDTLRKLAWLARDQGRNLKVVFVVRDLRAYLNSRTRKPNARTLLRNHRMGWLLGRLPIWIGETYCWLRTTVPIYLMLKSLRIDHLHIGYEELGLSPDETEDRLLSYLQVSGCRPDRRLNGSRHHMLQGNKVFIHARRGEGFHYTDMRSPAGLSRACRWVVGLLAPLNRRMAYPNLPALLDVDRPSLR